MTTLKDRLTHAMGDRFKQADLARECRISTAAVNKWFSQKTKSIAAEHVFTIARLCNVDAEWLATGKGRPERGLAQARADSRDIPANRIALLNAYAKLPQELRFPLRMLIETLGAAASDRYAKWSTDIEAFNGERDSKSAKPKHEKAR